MNKARWVVLFSVLAIAFAQSASPVKKQLDLSGESQWTDTGVELQAGDSLTIEAAGTLQYAGQKLAGPEGLSRGFLDLLKMLPFSEAGRGALLGRIGDSEAARPFLVGPRRQMKVPVAGKLFLTVNQALARGEMENIR